MSDTNLISFRVTTKLQGYGDGAKFHKFRILMCRNGIVVGVEDGPGRTHVDRAAARRGGYERIKELRTHELYVIHLYKADIEHGKERSCNNCAIALALWKNMGRMGLNEHDFNFRVEPYGAFVDVNGIVLEYAGIDDVPDVMTGEAGMPDMVTQIGDQFFTDSMYEWAVHWDEWAESRHMTLAEWKEEHGEDDSKPSKPSSCSFVLDMTAMKPESDQEAVAR